MFQGPPRPQCADLPVHDGGTQDPLGVTLFSSRNRRISSRISCICSFIGSKAVAFNCSQLASGSGSTKAGTPVWVFPAGPRLSSTRPMRPEIASVLGLLSLIHRRRHLHHGLTHQSKQSPAFWTRRDETMTASGPSSALTAWRASCNVSASNRFSFMWQSSQLR